MMGGKKGGGEEEWMSTHERDATRPTRGDKEERGKGREKRGPTLGEDSLNGHRKLAACLKLGP